MLSFIRRNGCVNSWKKKQPGIMLATSYFTVPASQGKYGHLHHIHYVPVCHEASSFSEPRYGEHGRWVSRNNTPLVSPPLGRILLLRVRTSPLQGHVLARFFSPLSPSTNFFPHSLPPPQKKIHRGCQMFACSNQLIDVLIYYKF